MIQIKRISIFLLGLLITLQVVASNAQFNVTDLTNTNKSVNHVIIQDQIQNKTDNNLRGPNEHQVKQAPIHDLSAVIKQARKNKMFTDQQKECVKLYKQKLMTRDEMQNHFKNCGVEVKNVPFCKQFKNKKDLCNTHGKDICLYNDNDNICYYNKK